LPSYTPSNPDVLSLAFGAATAGQAQGGRDGQVYAPEAAYAALTAAAMAFAIAVDLALDLHEGSLDEVAATIILEASYGYWGQASRVAPAVILNAFDPITGNPRDDSPTDPQTYAGVAAGMKSYILEATALYVATTGTSPPLWNSGGGGSSLPTTGAIGDVLTVTVAGEPPSPTSVAWEAPTTGDVLPETTVAGDLLTVTVGGETPSASSTAWLPAGGSAITSFTGITASFDLGESEAHFTWAATANNIPTTATLSWTGVATGSTPVTPGESMGGTVNGPFVGDTNGSTLVVTLTCVFPDGTKTATQTQVWEFRVVYLPTGDTLANVEAANAAYLETVLTSFQLHASPGGNYAAAPTGTNVFPIAIPTALAPGNWVVGSFPVTPTEVGVIAGYTNPYGITYSMTLYYFPNATNTYTWQ